MDNTYVKEFIKNAIVNDINIGCSGDSVREIVKDNNIYYIKQAKGNKLDREYFMFNYLKNKIPVPEVIYFNYDGEYSTLITRKLDGDMICCDEIFDDMHHVIDLAVDALKILQNTDISNCPIYNNLDIKLAVAKYNIDNNLVTKKDMNKENQKRFGSTENLYKYLVDNKINEEKLCLSHGDLSLPNIFFKDDKVTGFIDLGDSGIADYWYDIAILVKSLRRNYECKEAEEYLFKKLNIIPNYTAIEYYILLTELFL